MRTTLPTDIQQRILDLHAEGKKPPTIARLTDVGGNAVRRIIRIGEVTEPVADRFHQPERHVPPLAVILGTMKLRARQIDRASPPVEMPVYHFRDRDFVFSRVDN